jgi:hypothetical protein
MSETPTRRRDLPRRSWLPRDRTAPLASDAAPWVPAGFAHQRISWTTLSYIVVDELSKQIAGLVVASWPRLDQKGRVRFSGSSWRVGARVDELVALLDADRIVSEPRAPRSPAGTVGGSPAGAGSAPPRPVRIGDAFAAQVRRPRGRRAAVPPLERWLSPPVYDVSADARDAAKAALFGAVAPTMSEDDVSEIAAEALDLAE